MRILLLLALVLASPARAGTPGCFFGFAALSEAETPDQELIERTYVRLLDVLGGDRLSEGTLARMVESGDPFALPEAAEQDSLRQKLKEMERLLDLKGWNLPAIRAQLVQRLVQVQRRSEEAQRERDRAVKESWQDYTILLPNQSGIVNAPEGAGLVGTSGWKPSHVPNQWHYFDPITRTVTAVDIPGDFELGPTPPIFLPGGKEVLLRLSNELWRAPLVAGKPDWTKKTIHPFPEGTQLRGNVRKGNSPHFVYLDTQGRDLLRFDTRDNTFKKLNILPAIGTQDGTPEGAPSAVKHWSLIPGTDELSFLIQDKKAFRSVTATVNGDGELQRSSEGPAWKIGKGGSELPSYISWSADGATAYVYDFSNTARIETFARGQDQAKPLPATVTAKAKEFDGFYAFALDQTGVLGAFVHREANAAQSKVRLFDQKTGVEVGAITVSEKADDLFFTGDGKALVVTDRMGRPASVFNLNRYTSSP